MQGNENEQEKDVSDPIDNVAKNKGIGGELTQEQKQESYDWRRSLLFGKKGEFKEKECQ